MATFRSIGHRRPVFNGVSGYEPSHYTPLIEGIRSKRSRDAAGPQHPAQSFAVDLCRVHDVGGVTASLGEWARDFPRLLAIDVSADARTWRTVWQGPTVANTFLAAARAPREVPVRFAFASQPARFVRLRQMGTSTNLWAIAELHVHRPRPR